MRRRWAVIGIGAAIALGGAVWTATPVTAGNPGTTFFYDGNPAGQSCVIGSGVTQVTINARGAAGGSTGNSGGLGAFVLADVPVTPGETLTVFVGGSGDSGGFNGGGAGASTGGGGNSGATGGGASDVRRGANTLTDRIVIAGGGGGAGGVGLSGGGSGGAGGNGPEANGGNAGYGGAGGQGGFNGGAGGAGFGGAGAGTAGSAGLGGPGGIPSNYDGGGGGGGGATGGGGGGGNDDFSGGAGGGGGGSSFVIGTAIGTPTFTSGTQPGDGLVIITPPCGSVATGAQPDVQVRKGTTLPYVGDNIYYPTVQKVKTNIPGNSQTFQYKVENDGPSAMSFTVQGSPGTAPITAKYKVDGTVVTSAIVAGTYVTPVLDPGESITITLNVGGTASVPDGTKKGFTIRATATSGPALLDAATGKMTTT